MQTHELFEEGDSIHVRHFHIQSEHVWLQVFDFLSCNQRIRGRGHHLEYRIFLKDCRKKLAHKRRVVNDQHANLSCDGHKGSPTAFVLSSSNEALLRSSCHHPTKPPAVQGCTNAASAGCAAVAFVRSVLFCCRVDRDELRTVSHRRPFSVSSD